jgi:hypothetical protein
MWDAGCGVIACEAVLQIPFMQLLALIGEHFESSSDICGVVMSIRYHDDTLSLWNRNSEDEASVQSLK